MSHQGTILLGISFGSETVIHFGLLHFWGGEDIFIFHPKNLITQTKSKDYISMRWFRTDPQISFLLPKHLDLLRDIFCPNFLRKIQRLMSPTFMENTERFHSQFCPKLVLEPIYDYNTKLHLSEGDLEWKKEHVSLSRPLMSWGKAHVF